MLMFFGCMFWLAMPSQLASIGLVQEDKQQQEGTKEGEKAPCRLDIDIFAPMAQARPPRLIPENVEATQGAHGLVNNDIDAAGAAFTARLQNANDLKNVGARNDLVVAPIADEDDLVRIVLRNPDNLNPVYLNVYAFALENGQNVPTRNKKQSPLVGQNEVRIWRNATKAGNPVTLPHAMGGATETLYVEGLKAGRYRLALFHLNGINLQKARKVKATFAGNPQLFPAPDAFTLTLEEGRGVKCKKTPVVCFDHVRMTVAMVDMSQAKCKDVYDMLWGGRPIVQGRLWPRGGNYTWSQNAGLQGQWLNGNVHRLAVTARGQIAVGRRRQAIASVRAAFAHTLTALGRAAAGSTSIYAERWILNYQVEGVTLVRAEPVTLMVPQTATIGRQRNKTFPTPGRVLRNRTNSFNFGVAYRISEQTGRRLVGLSDADAYQKQYGSAIAVYEALGPRVNAAEQNDNLSHTFTSRHPNAATRRARTYTINIRTAQRSRAYRDSRLRTDGEFPDSFAFSISARQRNGLQQEIREGRLAANAVIFDVAQDIVTLLDNGAITYDLQLVQGNRLRVFAPALGAGNVLGPIGFQFSLGAVNGTQIVTNNPLRLPNNHNP